MTSLRTTPSVAVQGTLFNVASDPPDVSTVSTARTITVTRSPKRDRRDVFNAHLLAGLTLVGPFDIPRIESCTDLPAALVAYSETRRIRHPAPGTWVHFYEDDYRFTQLWRAPHRHFRRLRQFAGIISPDYSIYRDMPAAQRIAQTYRNQLLGARMQDDGMRVIANVRLSGRDSIPYALAGVPRHSSVALGLNGCTRDRQNRRHVLEEVRIVCDELAPAHLIVYGSAAYGLLDYPRELGIPVHVYPPDSFHRSQTRKAAA